MDTKFRASLLPQFLILFQTLFPKVISQSWDGIMVTQSDYQSLRALKHELVDPNGVLSSWNDTARDGACSGTWIGIKCADGQVIAIDLPWKNLSGRLTERIGQLPALRKISFHDNSISGPIPSSLGFLPELRGVQLYNNRFSGSIPGSLGLCPVLRTVELGNNFLTGIIPDSLVNCRRLSRLSLGNNSLTGPVPASLSQFQFLLFLSLESNNLSGSIPDSIGNLSSLRELDLSRNLLDGVLPGSLFDLKSLWVLNVSSNRFHGPIPRTVEEMFSLRAIDFSNNGFDGEIPGQLDDLPNLKTFNISYNNMSGAIPPSLYQKFDASSFIGNIKLCGYTGLIPCTSPPATPPSSLGKLSGRHQKLATKDIVLIMFGVLVIILTTTCCILLYCLLKAIGAAKEPGVGDKAAKGKTVISERGVEASGGKLVHFDGDMVFSADDLLCATAEVLGKSTYGTVYKATMENGDQVVVKRLREKVTKGQKEFETQVIGLGEIRHPNVVGIRAFYSGPKGEKLLVCDYMPNGNLATFLHGKGTTVNWAKRIKIVKDIAKGLSFLHNDAGMVHGNLTSNNVLIDKHENAKVSDFGLYRVTSDVANANVVATALALGYRAPELFKLKKATTKSDVYSFGVIMLEILTGKSPTEVSDGQDLPHWVASVVREEWTNEVFDMELIRDASAIGDELLIALRVALHCVDPTPAARLDTEQILNELAEIQVAGEINEQSPFRLKDN